MNKNTIIEIQNTEFRKPEPSLQRQEELVDNFRHILESVVSVEDIIVAKDPGPYPDKKRDYPSKRNNYPDKKRDYPDKKRDYPGSPHRN